MHLYELGNHENSDSPLPIHGPIYDWREALQEYSEQAQAFEALPPEDQSLIARRLDLQYETHSAQQAVIKNKAVFDEIVQRRIKGELVDLDSLEQARNNQSKAYERCLGVTAAVLEVEGQLYMRNLPSEPYLRITQRRDGQALADDIPTASGYAHDHRDNPGIVA